MSQQNNKIDIIALAKTLNVNGISQFLKRNAYDSSQQQFQQPNPQAQSRQQLNQQQTQQPTQNNYLVDNDKDISFLFTNPPPQTKNDNKPLDLNLNFYHQYNNSRNISGDTILNNIEEYIKSIDSKDWPTIIKKSQDYIKNNYADTKFNDDQEKKILNMLKIKYESIKNRGISGMAETTLDNSNKVFFEGHNKTTNRFKLSMYLDNDIENQIKVSLKKFIVDSIDFKKKGDLTDKDAIDGIIRSLKSHYVNDYLPRVLHIKKDEIEKNKMQELHRYLTFIYMFFFNEFPHDYFNILNSNSKLIQKQLHHSLNQEKYKINDRSIYHNNDFFNENNVQDINEKLNEKFNIDQFLDLVEGDADSYEITYEDFEIEFKKDKNNEFLNIKCAIKKDDKKNKIDLYEISIDEEFKNLTLQYRSDIIRSANKDLIEILERVVESNKNESISESYILKFSGKRLLIERNEIYNDEYFKKMEKDIAKEEKDLVKIEDDKEYDKKEKDLQGKRDKLERMSEIKALFDVYHHIQSLKDNEDKEAKKLISKYKEVLGFEPTILNFSLNSLSKFKNMCEFSRVISNIILSQIVNILVELNSIYYISSNTDLDQNKLKSLYTNYEKKYKNVNYSLDSEEVKDNFEKIFEKIKEDFGASSKIYTDSVESYKNIDKIVKNTDKRILGFKKILNDFWNEYRDLEDEKEKLQLSKEMLESFSEIKDSRDLKNLYILYLKNYSFFKKSLVKVMNENIKLNFDKVLEHNGKETFKNIYAEQDLLFKKMNDKLVLILGKKFGDGKLGEMFDEIEEKIKQINEELQQTPKDKKEDLTQEEKPVNTQKNNKDNKNIKKDESNEKVDTSDKKSNKQNLKISNNKIEIK